MLIGVVASTPVALAYVDVLQASCSSGSNCLCVSHFRFDSRQGHALGFPASDGVVCPCVRRGCCFARRRALSDDAALLDDATLLPFALPCHSVCGASLLHSSFSARKWSFRSSIGIVFLCSSLMTNSLCHLTSISAFLEPNLCLNTTMLTSCRFESANSTLRQTHLLWRLMHSSHSSAALAGSLASVVVLSSSSGAFSSLQLLSSLLYSETSWISVLTFLFRRSVLQLSWTDFLLICARGAASARYPQSLHLPYRHLIEFELLFECACTRDSVLSSPFVGF